MKSPELNSESPPYNMLLHSLGYQCPAQETIIRESNLPPQSLPQTFTLYFKFSRAFTLKNYFTAQTTILLA